MLHSWLLRQLQCKWDSNMWYCVSRYHSSLMTSFLKDIIPSWLNFQIAYVAMLVAEAVTVQMRQQYVILCFKIPFLLDDIIPWRHHSFLIKISHCLCCTVDWKHYIAYVALLVAEAVTVQMRQQYVILCFKIPFLLEDIIPSWLNFQIAYVVLLVAEAVTVQMRQQYVILCFKIPFLLDDIIP